MRAAIETQLAAHLKAELVSELLDAYAEVKRNFYLGGYRLTEVEGGRFSEAAFRVLEQVTTGSFTPLSNQVKTEGLIDKLRSLPVSKFPDSIRLHIPRALRLVYDIRNNRDAAHLADGIDPNLQDSSLVVSILDWVMAELVRLYHNVPADEAHRMVDQLVTRAAPIVQDFDGALKVLNPHLGAGDHCLVLLYPRGKQGATSTQLSQWVRPSMRANLKRTLRQLSEEKDLVHFDGKKYQITRLGERYVETNRLLDV